MIEGVPLTAKLRWNSNPNAASYVVQRVDGPSATPVQVSAPGWNYSMMDTHVPDPRVTYEFRVIANYKDGTWGMASASFKSPPPVNPTGFQVTLTAPDTVTLRWNPAPGAVQYRIDGPALPVTGMYLQQNHAQITRVPPGAQGWQLTAIYPGNFADYQNRSVATVVNRSLPGHNPRWLSKNNGEGNPAIAAAHYSRVCPNCVSPAGQPVAISGGNIASVMSALGVVNPYYDLDPFASAAYTNSTDLGKARRTQCPIQNAVRTVCWAISDERTLSLIVKDADGMVFMQFNNTDTTIYGNQYFGDKYTLTDRATFDSEGPKYVPHACLSCHGGRYDANTRKVVGGTLLPLDPGLLRVEPGHEERVRGVNATILRSNPPPAVASYIHELYGGAPFAAGAQARAKFVPSAWMPEASIYSSIVKPYCAMCHLAAPSQINFASPANFLQNKALIQASVCSGRSMPHAEVPFRAFWTADTGALFMPGVLAARLGYPSCP